MTYQEAYRKARRLVALGYGDKAVVIVKNERESHRAYYVSAYQCKREFFPILVQEL
mgnify:CR=1 FL=1